jgi:NADH-quinone oxidoreductase subunit L
MGGTIGFFLKSKKSSLLSAAFVFVGFISALRLVFAAPVLLRWEWVSGLSLGIRIDALSAVLISLVYFVSFLVHLFSVHYMHDEAGIKRYFFKLGFFTTSMLGLLSSDHILLLFVFWELVGFSSYLLIGFWFTDKEKATSARTAFMVNRVADAAFLIGIILLLTVFKMPFLSEIESVAPSAMVIFTGIAIAIGAFGKSAQFPFFGWLNKAMAGPTPVSALIHAATMVTAGIYLLVRVFPFLAPEVLTIIALVGAITAFMAGVSALFQHDIKAVLAYSTISQLGYMILGVGVGAFESSVFHLWTHAFFKAGLFLAAGNVIHFMHKANHDVNAQDMRNMGGLRKFLPFTFLACVVCGAALAGLPFTSGFLSKEGILGATLQWYAELNGQNIVLSIVPILAFTTALLTPFYITRQILLVFFDQSRTDIHIDKNEVFEPIFNVKIPFILLSLGAIWLFSSINPFDGHGWYLSHMLFEDHLVAKSNSFGMLTLILSVVLVGIGIGWSFMKYRPGSAYVKVYKASGEPKSIQGFWYLGWQVDKVYVFFNRGFVLVGNFAAWTDRKVIDRGVDHIGICMVILGKITGAFDKYVIDGLVNFVAGFFKWLGKSLSKMQAPNVQAQLLVMLFVVVFIIYWFLF